MTSIFAGSLAPFITASLLRAYDSSIPIAVYLLVAAVISTVAVSFARETKGISLESVDLADDAREPAGVPAH
jgi:hypothetical protein